MPTTTVTIRPLLPRMSVSLVRAQPITGSLTPVLPGAPVSGSQINDAAVSAGWAWSSARTAQEIDAAVAEELYDYDALVAATLSI